MIFTVVKWRNLFPENARPGHFQKQTCMQHCVFCFREISAQKHLNDLKKKKSLLFLVFRQQKKKCNVCVKNWVTLLVTKHLLEPFFLFLYELATSLVPYNSIQTNTTALLCPLPFMNPLASPLF